MDDVWALGGTSSFSRRGLTFGGSIDVCFIDRQLRDGVSAAIADRRRLAMARTLGVAPPLAGETPAASWVRFLADEARSNSSERSSDAGATAWSSRCGVGCPRPTCRPSMPGSPIQTVVVSWRSAGFCVGPGGGLAARGVSSASSQSVAPKSRVGAGHEERSSTLTPSEEPRDRRRCDEASLVEGQNAADEFVDVCFSSAYYSSLVAQLPRKCLPSPSCAQRSGSSFGLSALGALYFDSERPGPSWQAGRSTATAARSRTDAASASARAPTSSRAALEAVGGARQGREIAFGHPLLDGLARLQAGGAELAEKIALRGSVAGQPVGEDLRIDRRRGVAQPALQGRARKRRRTGLER